MLVQLDQMPVVETGSAHRVFVDAKAERTDQVQGAAGRRAQASHIAGIRRDLRFDQQHVEWTLAPLRAQAFERGRHATHIAPSAAARRALDGSPDRQVACVRRTTAGR